MTRQAFTSLAIARLLLKNLAGLARLGAKHEYIK